MTKRQRKKQKWLPYFKALKGQKLADKRGRLLSALLYKEHIHQYGGRCKEDKWV